MKASIILKSVPSLKKSIDERHPKMMVLIKPQSVSDCTISVLGMSDGATNGWWIVVLRKKANASKDMSWTRSHVLINEAKPSTSFDLQH